MLIQRLRDGEILQTVEQHLGRDLAPVGAVVAVGILLTAKAVSPSLEGVRTPVDRGDRAFDAIEFKPVGVTQPSSDHRVERAGQGGMIVSRLGKERVIEPDEVVTYDFLG